jgi:membrane protease YdiL (CAAX protease family)
LKNHLRGVLVSPAAWAFGLLWLASALLLSLVGQASLALTGLILLGGVSVFSLLTAAITEPNPPSGPPRDRGERGRLVLQLILVLLVVLLTGYRGLVFHEVLPSEPGLPGWRELVGQLERLGASWFGNDNYLANPVLYFVLPLVGLLLLGARPAGLGLGGGHRVWRVTVLWSALPLLVILYGMVAGWSTLGLVLLRLLSNALNNGFFEEFLFRGALQTRLRRFLAPSWALVAQALIFGAWHLGLGYSNTGGLGLLPALASTIASQAVLGLAFGFIFERTRNLVAPSIVHILLNSMGI